MLRSFCPRFGDTDSEPIEVLASMFLADIRELKRRQVKFLQEVKAGVDQLDRGKGIKIAANDLRAFFDDVQTRGQQRYEASKSIQ